jgi:hypothetical protein
VVFLSIFVQEGVVGYSMQADVEGGIDVKGELIVF